MKKFITTVFLGAALIAVWGVNAKPAAANFADGTGIWADSVYSYLPGLHTDGSALPTNVSDPWQALGPAEGVTAGTIIPAGSATSLGFGGQLIVKFDNTIVNGPGKDFRVIIAHTGLTYTYGANHRSPAPLARIAVSQNCWSYHNVGNITSDTSFDLGVYRYIKCVKITDYSNKRLYPADANGFSVDGIEALNTTADQPWQGTIRDLRWWKIDADKTNDVWLGHSIMSNRGEATGWCNGFWDQAIVFHNNFVANPVGADGVSFQHTVMNSVGLSTYDGMSMTDLHTLVSAVECSALTPRDATMRNLYLQIQYINLGYRIWSPATPAQ